MGQEEGRGHEGLRGQDGRDDHKQSLSMTHGNGNCNSCNNFKLLTVNFTQTFYTKQSLIFSILQKVSLSSKIGLDIFLELCAISFKYSTFENT